MQFQKQQQSRTQRLPKQDELPSRKQLQALLTEASAKPGCTIELPFGDPPEAYSLTVFRDRSKGELLWMLYRNDGVSSALEWSQPSQDSDQVHHWILAQFPGWDFKQKVLSDTGSHPIPSLQMDDMQAQTQSSLSRVTLEGDLKNYAVPNLLQSVQMGKMTGRLEIVSSKDMALLFFNDGNPVHCTMRAVEGDDAVVELMGWEEGKFRFYPESPIEKKTVKKRLDFLVMEGLTLYDQAKYVDAQGARFDAVLARINPNLSEAEFEKLVKEGAPLDMGVQKAFYLGVDGKSTLNEMLRRKPQPKKEWVPILFNLLQTKIVGVALPAAPVIDVTQPQRLVHQDWQQVVGVEKVLVRQDTGLYTYPTFLYFLQKEEQRFERFKHPFSIIHFRIKLTPYDSQDSFEMLTVGDSRAMALIIGRLKRQTDMLAHYQTWDYALLLPETEGSAARSFTARLAELLTTNKFYRDPGKFSIQLTMGAAGYPDDCMDLDDLLRLAEPPSADGRTD